MIYTNIPDRPPIRLVQYYPEFSWYYPNCEMVTKRWWVKNTQPDWVILDCGANVGYYSILFSQLAPQGKIFAFEPTDTVAMLAANLADNAVANVDVHKLALGAKSG